MPFACAALLLKPDDSDSLHFTFIEYCFCALVISVIAVIRLCCFAAVMLDLLCFSLCNICLALPSLVDVHVLVYL